MTRLSLAAMVLLTTTSSAYAHRLYVEASVRPGPPAVLRIEAWFEGDMPAESARITLTDATGATTEAGTADDTGTLTIPLPAAGAWTVAAESIGHRGEFIITVASTTEVVEEPAKVRPTGPEAGRIGAGLGMIATAFAGLRWRMRRQSLTAATRP